MLLPKYIKTILKILFAGVLFFLILNVFARTSGIGYRAKFTYADSGALPGRGSIQAYWVSGFVEIIYNPLFFPISFISGATQCFDEVKVIVYPEENITEMAALAKLNSELVRNIPYFLVVSFVFAFLFERWLSFVLKAISYGG